jgi:hypothetical protein
MPSGPTKRALLLLPLAALLTLLPLMLHGGSCGQDQVFHLQSWFDAAHQVRHGHYPQWAFTAAWNAGEPRFVFYPPLSWLLGALLTMHLPPAAAPVLYVYLALTAAGLAFYKLASNFAAPSAALLASAFYLANPYMLFNAFERSAYAELLAAAWVPLLLLGVLRERVTLRGIAVPLALLWLTNAPAAVMGSYTLALLATLRVLRSLFLSFCHSRRESASSADRSGLRLALTCIFGTVLGLALPAYYLLPAAIERKYVQVAMAIIPNMRYQDNFLFAHTADAAHNAVNHTASTLALSVITLTVVVLSALLLKPVALSGERNAQSKDPEQARPGDAADSFLPAVLVLLTVLITFLLVPISAPVWQHLPELAFLQFPWRLLTILSAVLSLALALLLGAPSSTRVAARQGGAGIGITLSALGVPLGLGLLCFHFYAQACEAHDTPASIAQLLHTGHGLGPTDEYTPNNADNDVLRTDNPGYWLAAHPHDPAPNTVPTATELHPEISNDDNPVPVEQTVSQQAPHHFTVQTNASCFLVLNLRDYPNWLITVTGPHGAEPRHPVHLQRDDGLIAFGIPSGVSMIDIAWRRSWDQDLGFGMTGLALLVLALPSGSRRIVD